MENINKNIAPRPCSDSYAEMTELVMPNDTNMIFNLMGGTLEPTCGDGLGRQRVLQRTDQAWQCGDVEIKSDACVQYLDGNTHSGLGRRCTRKTQVQK